MRFRRARSASLGFLVFALALALPACDDDPSGPDLPSPTLENVWPSEDGRSWIFAGASRLRDEGFLDADGIYSDPDSVPPAPSVDAILPLLDHPSLPKPYTSTEEIWRLRFDGTATTESGMTGQNLVEEQDMDAGGAVAMPDGFLARLSTARPDLRPALARAGWHQPLRAAESFEPVEAGLLYLHGGVWERSADWIVSYGALDTLLAWKYLEKDLSRGHRFTHQLVPSLANDVFLHALVRNRESLTTPVGEFQNVLEVAYLVDFGISAFTEAGSTDPFQFFRVISIGNVFYAPTVGPVATYERDLLLVGPTLGPGVGDRTLVISGVRAGPNP